MKRARPSARQGRASFCFKSPGWKAGHPIGRLQVLRADRECRADNPPKSLSNEISIRNCVALIRPVSTCKSRMQRRICTTTVVIRHWPGGDCGVSRRASGPSELQTLRPAGLPPSSPAVCSCNQMSQMFQRQTSPQTGDARILRSWCDQMCLGCSEEIPPKVTLRACAGLLLIWETVHGARQVQLLVRELVDCLRIRLSLYSYYLILRLCEVHAVLPACLPCILRTLTG